MSPKLNHLLGYCLFGPLGCNFHSQCPPQLVPKRSGSPTPWLVILWPEECTTVFLRLSDPRGPNSAREASPTTSDPERPAICPQCFSSLALPAVLGCPCQRLCWQFSLVEGGMATVFLDTQSWQFAGCFAVQVRDSGQAFLLHGRGGGHSQQLKLTT